MSRQKHDWTTFTGDIESTDLYGNAFRRALKADTYSGKTVFKAVALTDMFPLSSNEAMAIDGGSTGTSGKERYAFKGRVIGANSPHSFLPDPCDPSFVPDNNAAYRTIALHTTFISTNVIEVDPVTRGDIVLVELEKTDLAYDLEYGRFLSVTSQEAPTDTAGTQCYSLKDLVGEWDGPTAGPVTIGTQAAANTGKGGRFECGGKPTRRQKKEGISVRHPVPAGGCGPKDDPTFAKCSDSVYPTLPTQATTFYRYTQAEVLQAIKATSHAINIQKIMYAYIKKEQGKFSFPNNNPSGIQLDNRAGFAGTTEADYDYQTCYRDSGGEQRIFPGFNTLSRAMEVFGKIVKGKSKYYYALSNDVSGAKLKSDSDNLAWNYYRQWRYSLTTDQANELYNTNKTKKGGSIIEVSMDATKATFRAALSEFNSAQSYSTKDKKT